MLVLNAELSSVTPRRSVLSRRHGSSQLDPGRPGDHREPQDTYPRTLSRRPPPLHLPHTISSRTITSVATNTSRVSPTLCHILRAGGWTQTQRRMAGRLGDMGGGRPRAAPPGGGTGRCGGGSGGVGPQTCPNLLRPGRPSRGRSGRAARRHYRLIAPGSRGHGVQRPAANGRAAMAATEEEGVSVEVARRPQGPGCGSCEDPSALRDARCQPLPEAAAAAPPIPPPPPPQQLIARHPLRNDSAAARGLLGNAVQSLVHAAGICPTRNYNSQDSTLLKVSPRSPFPVPCAFGILEPPPLKTAS